MSVALARRDLTLFVWPRRRKLDAAARQRLAQKNLDLGIHAAQIGGGKPFHRGENLWGNPQSKGTLFR
jgi:hypothetical protein